MGENQSSGEEEAYRDRNLAILAYLKKKDEIFDFFPNLAAVQKTFGWKEADDEDDKWVIVWSREGFGQMAWHMPRDLVTQMDWLPKRSIEWDGHTRNIKNKRIEKYLGVGEE